AYMADISDDNLYSIDLSTGAGTLVGPLGIDISFAQDADFDPTTGTLYMAAYIGGGINSFCTVDILTGTATPVGTINSDDAEVTLVAIEGSLSVEKVGFDNSIALFPNPAHDQINITSLEDKEIQKISIFDL